MWSFEEVIETHPDIVDKDPQYLCVYCFKGLLHPKQLLCGHRLCSPCFEQLKNNSLKIDIITCPAKSNEHCEDSPVKDIFPDKSVKKDMKKILVFCPFKLSGCTKVLLYSQLKDHIMKCHHADETLYPSNIQYLQSQQTSSNQHCKFIHIGCQQHFESSKDLVCHESDVVVHMDIIIHNFETLEKESMHLKSCLEQLNDSTEALKQQHEHMKDMYDELSIEVEKLQKMNEQQKDVVKALQKLSGCSEAPDIIVPFVLQEETRNSLIHQDRMIGLHDINLTQINLMLKTMETTSYTGILIWEVADYHTKRTSLENRPISSPIFFTSRYGYKMMCRLYLNGDGPGQGTHLSLFFALLKGDYDDILPWPFSKRISLVLIDQSNIKKDITYSFEPDRKSLSFQKPREISNVAFGCPLFVQHSVLENTDEPYLKNDKIYIKINVGNEDR